MVDRRRGEAVHGVARGTARLGKLIGMGVIVGVARDTIDRVDMKGKASLVILMAIGACRQDVPSLQGEFGVRGVSLGAEGGG